MSAHIPLASAGLDARLEALRPGLETLGLPACVLDTAERYRLVNAPYEAHVGLTAAQLIGRTPQEAFAQRPRDERRSYLLRALAGEAVAFNRQTIEGPKHGMWVRAHYLPLRDGTTVVGALVVLVDIQQLKDAEAAILEREREIEDQRKQLQLVVDNIGVPIAYIDRGLCIQFANQPAGDWPAVSVDAVGRRLDELYDAQTLAEVGPHLSAAFAGEKRTYERAARSSKGGHRWVRVHLVPDVATNGEVRGVYTLMTDIDEDRRMREALERQQAQVRLYTDNVPDAVAYLDSDRRVLFANRLFAAQRKTTPEQIVGRTTSELMGGDTASWIAERTQRVLDHGEEVAYEREVKLADGGMQVLWVKVVPDIAPAGGVRGMYVVAHDITELKQAQARLAASEEEVRFFAENIPEAIVFVDLERGCTFVNNTFLATRGLTREATLGRQPSDVFPADVMATLAPHVARALKGEESFYERMLALPSGEERWVRVRVAPRRAADGRVTGYYVVSTDIHELKTAHSALEDKERQLRQVIDSIPTPMVYCDAERRYRYVNKSFLDLVGLEASKVIGHTTLELFGEERWAAFEPVFERVKAGESVSMERLLNFADGTSRWMLVRFSPRLDEHGRFAGFYSTTSDVHEQKLVEQELRRANTILSAHFDNTPLAVIEWDTQMHIVRWSGQAEAIFGWSASEMLGRGLSGWRNIYEDDERAAIDMIRGLVEGNTRHATLLIRNYRKDGSVIWVEWHNSALRDQSGAVISILSLGQDVSSRIQAEERLQFMATHDGLTELPNSVLLNDRLDNALARARRSRTRVGVMFLDLDHFKDVNDTLGHRVGDALLKDLARRIRAMLRQSDLLARISGDEFVVVLEDVSDDYAPEHVARKILEEVRRPFLLDGHEVQVSCSLGLALHPEDGSDAETLLKNADAAMYHAKELGRNSFRPFSVELGERRDRRMGLEAALRRALRLDELALHYQPIMDIETGAIERVEALLRWNHPERGLVLPASFIPVAEETGLGHALGTWVLEAACRQARAWREAGLAIAVCVNLSASQLRDTSLAVDLKHLLERNGCDPSWLQLEITETSMVRDVEGTGLVLARLRNLGVRVAIDDFGTGFSSLSHLRHLPVDALKIDKSFVADIDSAPRSAARDVAGGAAIVSAVIGLARGLGLGVVAEGVEKESHLEYLRNAGCGGAQGYLICRPVPPADFERWLGTRRAPRGKPRKRRAAEKHA